MRGRWPPRWVALAAGFLLAIPATASPPDVLLVVIDTLRADRLGSYGAARDTSPHLDALARRGVRYERAISQAPWTTPSVGSLLTSRYPSQLGIRREVSRLPDSARTLPEVLRDHGYRTGAVVSHDFCGSRWNFQQGFESFDESAIVAHDASSSRQVSDRAVAFLERADDRPFFLWLHYFDPHFDYLEHAGHRFDAEPGSGPGSTSFLTLSARHRGGRLSAEELQEALRHYDSEIAYTDAQVGRVLAALEASGRLARTLVVVTADHGEEFLDHGKLGHGHALHQELVRVPLIVVWPRGPRGVVEEGVALLDVLPTILEAAGVAPPEAIEGRPLPRPGAPAPPSRVFYSETSRPREPGERAVFSGDEKLIVKLGRKRRARLYDLAADPGETRDRSPEEPERAAALSGALDAWLARVRLAGGTESELELTPRERDRLRRLGYLEASDGNGP